MCASHAVRSLPIYAPFKKTRVTAASLTGIKVFEGLSRKNLEAIAELSQGRRYPSRAEIISYQDDSDDVFFIVSGKVQVTVFSASGKVITFQDLHQGEMFGELAAIDKLPRTASIRTVTETFVVRVSAGAFLDLLWSHRALGQRILMRLTKLVRFLCERVVEFHALPVAGRIHAEVLRMASAETADGNTVTLYPAPVCADIASRAGTRREAVSRELTAMEERGLVRRHHNALIVSNLGALTRLLEEELGRPISGRSRSSHRF